MQDYFCIDRGYKERYINIDEHIDFKDSINPGITFESDVAVVCRPKEELDCAKRPCLNFCCKFDEVYDPIMRACIQVSFWKTCLTVQTYETQFFLVSRFCFIWRCSFWSWWTKSYEPHRNSKVKQLFSFQFAVGFWMHFLILFSILKCFTR